MTDPTHPTLPPADPTLQQQYWDNRWQQGATGWDLGQPSPPLLAYLSQYRNRAARVLLPGCGSAHEAVWMAKEGFTDLTVLDIAPTVVSALRSRFAHLSAIRVVGADFFDHTDTYDLILEQTFFCALPPQQRGAYAQHMHRLLRPGGQLVGVLFRRQFEHAGPPHGGSIDEYSALFSPLFEVRTIAPCYNSAAPRADTEAFVILRKLA